MSRFSASRTFGLLACVVTLAACATGGSAGPARPEPAMGDAAAVTRARADSARLPYVAGDIHFMSAMIGHHAQALIMARWAPTHGAGAEVRRLAERIINAQADEIHIMQTWLKDRGQPVPEAKAGPMKMMMNGMQHDMLMPGMLSDEQMKQLDSAQGSDFDRLFLGFMIQHHRGAVGMVKELFATYGAGQDETVFKFASDVNIDQATEIARMEKMLAALVLGVQLP